MADSNDEPDRRSDEPGGEPTRRAEKTPEELAAAAARKAAVEEAVGKARAGGKKVAGWLGARLGSAVEEIKGNQAVQRKLDLFSRIKRDKAREREFSGLDGIYTAILEDITGVKQGIEDKIAEIAQAIDVVQQNIGELRLSGVAEDDEEMLEYRGHVQEMHNDTELLHAKLEPLRDEEARMQRHRKAAAARYVSDADLLRSLTAEARQQIGAARRRLGKILADEAPELLAERDAEDETKSETETE